MEPLQSEVVLRRRHLDSRHQFPGGHDAVAADQPLHLRPKRKKRYQINQRQPPQEDPSYPDATGRFQARPRIDSVELREKRPVQGHFLVERFAQLGKRAEFLIQTPHPPLPPALGQRTKHRLCPPAHRAVGQNQVDGFSEVRRRNFRELRGYCGVLERKIIHGPAGRAFPADDPAAAELAIAVKHQQGPGRRRLNSADLWHTRKAGPSPPAQFFSKRNSFEDCRPKADSTLSMAG